MTTSLGFPAGAIGGTAAPVWVEGPTYASLANPAPSIGASKIRATQAPIGSSGASIPISTTPELYATVTVTSTTPIVYPLVLTPQNSGSPSLQSITYLDGATNPTTLTLAANTITVNSPTFTVLPIDLLDFKARAQGKSNLIEWSTASERNTAWHVIERSKDGIGSWSEIGKLAAAGTSSDLRQYRLEDVAPLNKSYYRLRSVDFDGQEERSSVVLVTRKSGIFGVTGVYPSPTADLLNVQFESLEEAPVTIQVRDLAGRLVLEQQVQATKGENLNELSLVNLAAGTYSVQLVTDGLSSAQVMVVKQ